MTLAPDQEIAAVVRFESQVASRPSGIRTWKQWIAEIYASMLDSYRRTLVAAGFVVEHMQPGNPFQ